MSDDKNKPKRKRQTEGPSQYPMSHKETEKNHSRHLKDHRMPKNNPTNKYRYSQEPR